MSKMYLIDEESLRFIMKDRGLEIPNSGYYKRVGRTHGYTIRNAIERGSTTKSVIINICTTLQIEPEAFVNEDFIIDLC